MIEFHLVPYFSNAFFLILQQALTPEETESVNFCLALLRNILHIPERPSTSHPQMLLAQSFIDHTTYNSQQNQIVVNLFAQGLGPLLLKLLESTIVWSMGPKIRAASSIMFGDQLCGMQG
jgi:hypothetical protein